MHVVRVITDTRKCELAALFDLLISSIPGWLLAQNRPHSCRAEQTKDQGRAERTNCGPSLVKQHAQETAHLRVLCQQ